MPSKISSFLIAIIIVGVFASVFGLYFTGISDNYSRGFDNNTFSAYNKITNISSNTEEIESTLQSDEVESSGIFDLAGDLLKSGYNVLRLSFDSFGVFKTMATDAGEQLNQRSGGAISGLFTAPLIIIAIIILLFIIIGVLVGSKI